MPWQGSGAIVAKAPELSEAGSLLPICLQSVNPS